MYHLSPVKGVARQDASCWEVTSCCEEAAWDGSRDVPARSGAFLTGPYSCA